MLTPPRPCREHPAQTSSVIVVISQRPQWWAHARCLGLGVDLFFGADGHETVTARRKREQEAKAVCRNCPVIVECLADALKFSDDGVRGGLTRYERQQTAPRQVIDDDWVLIAQSAGIKGHSSLERRDAPTHDTLPTFRVMKGSRVLKQTNDETEAWIALHNSDL